jgi:hypothetical protein
VYRIAAETYSISLDVTDSTAAGAIVRWQSHSHLSEGDVLRELARDGVPASLATALIGKAPMPEACLGEAGCCSRRRTTLSCRRGLCAAADRTSLSVAWDRIPRNWQISGRH